MMEIFRKLNWIDLLMLVLLVRIVYISTKTGFVTEFMKTIGVLLSCFFAYHYYVKLAAMVGRFTNMPESTVHAVMFGVIAFVVFGVCQLIRNALFIVFTVQTLSLVDRWGAAIVSLARIFITASMLLFVFLLTDMPYMERMIDSSISKKYVLHVAPSLYYNLTRGVVAKFFPDQKVNPAVAQTLEKVSSR